MTITPSLLASLLALPSDVDRPLYLFLCALGGLIEHTEATAASDATRTLARAVQSLLEIVRAYLVHQGQGLLLSVAPHEEREGLHLGGLRWEAHGIEAPVFTAPPPAAPKLTSTHRFLLGCTLDLLYDHAQATDALAHLRADGAALRKALHDTTVWEAMESSLERLRQVLELQGANLGQVASVLTGERSQEVLLEHALQLRSVLVASADLADERTRVEAEALWQAARAFAGEEP